MIDNAHNTTVYPILLVLDIPDKYYNYFAYSLYVSFEIWIDKNYIKYIKIYLNGIDITCESKLCNNSCLNSEKNECKYKDFKNEFLNGKSEKKLWKMFLEIC